MGGNRRIVDPLTNVPANVTDFGQLVVAPIDYSTPIAQQLPASAQAFNFIEPKQDRIIVITDILLATDKSAAINGTIIEVYDTSASDSIVIDELIIRADLTRQGIRDLTGLNLRIPAGKWVNAKADGIGSEVTIMFYYAPILRSAGNG